MISNVAFALHAGPGQEITFLEYLFRVALYLLAFGGIAVLVDWLRGTIDGFRTAFEGGADGREIER